MNHIESPLNDYWAEQAVLGAIFLEPDCLDEITFLESRDFSVKNNELIFGVMRYLRDIDIPIDLITVSQHFQKRGRTKDMGGLDYLSKLSLSSPTAANVKYYAQEVRSKAHRRRAMEVSKDIVEISTGGEYTIQIVPNPTADKYKAKEMDTDEDFFAAVEERVYDLRPQKTSRMRSFKESNKEYFEHLKSKAAKLMTGVFPQFDLWAMLWIGWLYIIAGRPSVGKTAKALQLAYGIAKFNKKAGPVLIFSQEMDTNEVKDRMVASKAGVNYNKLINKGGEHGFTVEEWTKIEEAYAELETLQIFVQDSAGVTIDEIRATARQFIKEYGKISAIIVDYLQIMEIPQRKGENRTQAIGRVTRAAKTMARNMKFVMIILSQLDRAADDEEPKLRHLKESGSIEQDADVVEFLWWDGELVDGVRVVQSIFAKGRNVGLNRFRYLFRWWHQKYIELEKRMAMRMAALQIQNAEQLAKAEALKKASEIELKDPLLEETDRTKLLAKVGRLEDMIIAYKKSVNPKTTSSGAIVLQESLYPTQDPRPDLQEDAEKWTALLKAADEKDRGAGRVYGEIDTICGILNSFRCGGTRLRAGKVAGQQMWVLKADIDPTGQTAWDSQEEYNDFRTRYLQPWGDVLPELLNELTVQFPVPQ